MTSRAGWAASDLLHTRIDGAETRLAGTLAHSDYAIRVDDATWAPHGEALLHSDRFFLHWTRSCTAQIDVALEGGSFRRLSSLFFLPPNTSLQCRWESGRSRSVSCSFTGRLLEQAGALLAGLRDVRTELMLDVADPFVEAAMLRITEEVLEPGLDSDVAVECLIRSLASSLHRALTSAGGPGNTGNGASSRQLARFTETVREWEGKLPTLNQLARHCDMDAGVLARAVRRSAGVSMREFIANERLHRAKGLLRNEAILIKQVSFRCGFTSPAAFTAAFRRSAGLTPAEYRARCPNRQRTVTPCRLLMEDDDLQNA